MQTATVVLDAGCCANLIEWDEAEQEWKWAPGLTGHGADLAASCPPPTPEDCEKATPPTCDVIIWSGGPFTQAGCGCSEFSWTASDAAGIPTLQEMALDVCDAWGPGGSSELAPCCDAGTVPGAWDYTRTNIANSWTSWGASNECPVSPNPAECDGEASCGILAECGDSGAAPLTTPAPPGSDRELTLAPSLSFVRLLDGTAPVFTGAVEGTIFLDEDSTQVDEMLLSVGDITYDGVDYEGFAFWLPAPLTYTLASGVFTIPAGSTKDVRGAGEVDGLGMFVNLPRPVAAVGTLNTTSGAWDLDFAGAANGLTLEVHLEGTSVATSQ